MKDHVAWFRRHRPRTTTAHNDDDDNQSRSSSSTSLLWIQRQLQIIEQLHKDTGGAVCGVHCMPMANMKDLLAILEDDDDDDDAETKEEDNDRRRRKKKNFR